VYRLEGSPSLVGKQAVADSKCREASAWLLVQETLEGELAKEWRSKERMRVDLRWAGKVNDG